MELRQLRHFVMLAEEMHFGRAAKRLFLSQPALSTSIMRLERELSVRLFDRDSKSMSLTPVGRALAERAREIVSLADKFDQFGRAMANGRAGFIDAGFTATLLFRGLDTILERFEVDYPDIELSLHEMPTQMQIERLRNGHLDAGFVNSPVPPANLESMPLYEERFVACVPERHPLASKPEVDVRELRDEPFVMFSRDVSPAYYDHLIAMCASAGFEPHVRISASLLLTVVTLVASGFGISIVPESVEKSGIPRVRFIPLCGAERRPSAYMVWNREHRAPGLIELIEMVRRIRKAAE
ncbi:MAG: LysR substrate-binding domain-containing protein [Pigmentiphaga sp.]